MITTLKIRTNSSLIWHRFFTFVSTSFRTHHYMRKIYLLLLSTMPLATYAQRDTTLLLTDTLSLVTIRAYEQNMPLMKTPAAVNVVSSQDLNKYSNTSILPAVNATPGVRMEERSPNSYRFGIRGSAAQAPFGVRNIKMYYNDIPFTDAGGNTYLNNLGFYNMQGLEIIKGPAGSLYGAGTGGAVLINSFPADMDNKALVHYTTGSFGLQNIAGEFYINNGNAQHAIRYQHAESKGYRQHSASKKDIFSYDVAVQTSERNELSAHFLYTDLTYQTPGGLTLSQFNNDPQIARPGTATVPGAVDNKATIYQKAFLAGVTNKFRISDKWQNSTTLFASHNQLINPTLRNYSRSSQPNVGGRTTFKYNTTIGKSSLQWITGAEVLQQFVTEKTYTNILGTPGAMTNDVEVNNFLAFGFTQLTWTYERWIVTGGISLNTLQVGLSNFMPTYTKQTKQFNNQLAPRLAIMRQFKNNSALYVSAEKGYTPPSVSELAPTGSNVNLGLQAAQGWNLSVGCRGYALNDRFFFDINMFLFRLSQSIVQRRDSAGGDYYVNAGGTEQNGADILLRYSVIRNTAESFFKNIDLSVAFSGYRFTYSNFVQVDQDYSGNWLPGVPRHTVSTMLDINTNFGGYLNLNYYYCEPIYLNDANTDQANDYTLLGGRIGYRKTIKRVLLDVFAGGDNLLDKKYSLGNDINAAGGRYYNAAPGINFFAGLTFGYKYKE